MEPVNPFGGRKKFSKPSYGLVKLIVPLLLTYNLVNEPPPKGMANGAFTVVTASSPRFKLVPLIVR